MNASLQMLVEPIMFVITPLDRTGVNVQMDLLLIPVHRTHWIQFVLVRRWIIKKMTEKRDRDSVSCNIKVHELLIRLVSCTLALRNKLHQIINVSLLDWSWSFILAKEDNGIFCPTKFIAMLRFEVVGAMTKLLKRWCLVIVNYNTFKSDLFW